MNQIIFYLKNGHFLIFGQTSGNLAVCLNRINCYLADELRFNALQLRSKEKFDHNIRSQVEWHPFGIIIVIMLRVLKYVENRTLQSNKIL